MHLIDPDFETSFWSRPKTGGGGRGVFRPLTDFFLGGGGLGPRQDFWEIQEKVPFLHLFFAFFVSLFLLLFHLFLQNLRIWGRRNWFRDGLTQKFLKQSGEHLWNWPPPPNRFRNPPPPMKSSLRVCLKFSTIKCDFQTAWILMRLFRGRMYLKISRNQSHDWVIKLKVRQIRAFH